MKKNSGVTLIELMIVIALLAIVGVMGYGFFRNTFRTWRQSRDIVQIQSDARMALDEMSLYLRQASTSPITVSVEEDSIEFEIGKSTTDWGHQLRKMKYFQFGDSLLRLMKGSTDTLVSEGVDNFTVDHTTTGARYETVDVWLFLTKGDQWKRFDRNITLRSRIVE